jgi:hypothetical protein
MDKFNPWGRNWWGGTPPGWADNIHSARSALCLSKEGYVGYFWSASISPDDLAAALLAARCQYGIHLDMNPGHAGFEFYNVQPESSFAPLGRPMQTDWENDGKVPQMPGWSFRARRMIRGMGHMNFPRYIQRDGRDFFYLTTRVVLPGPALASGASSKEAGEGEWRVKGLPQHGFPYALSTTWVRPDGATKVKVLRVDPRAVKPPGHPSAAADAPTVLAWTGAPSGGGKGDPQLWFTSGGFLVAAKAPSEDATPLLQGAPSSYAQARAAVGIDDEDGMLTWVELPAEAIADAKSAAMLLAMLDKMGCSQRMLVGGPQRALLGGTLDIAGAPATGVTTPTARLVRGRAPGAHAMFEDTALVPFNVWQPMQAARVKMSAKTAPPPPKAPTPSSTAQSNAPPPKPTTSATPR